MEDISDYVYCLVVMQAGVQLPDAGAAGRVAFNVAQNLTEKARDRLEEVQEDAQHSLSLAVGVEDGPNEENDSAEGEREQDDHGKSHFWCHSKHVHCSLPVVPEGRREALRLPGNRPLRIALVASPFCASTIQFRGWPKGQAAAPRWLGTLR